MFETLYAGTQEDMFPTPDFEQLIERRAAEIRAEIAVMAARAIEEIDRRLAFFNRSQAQRRRFERYRQLATLQPKGDQK